VSFARFRYKTYAEIANLYFLVTHHKQILGFHVTIDYSFFMQIVKSFKSLEKVVVEFIDAILFKVSS